MNTPWTMFFWSDIYEEHRYFVQQTLRDADETHSIMNHIVYHVSCSTANRIEDLCVKVLKEIIDRFKKENSGKEPEDCDWLDFVFHHNALENYIDKLIDDEMLGKELEHSLAGYAHTIAETICREYNLLINSRTKASMGKNRHFPKL